jgi:hypothetical protein
MGSGEGALCPPERADEAGRAHPERLQERPIEALSSLPRQSAHSPLSDRLFG